MDPITLSVVLGAAGTGLNFWNAFNSYKQQKKNEEEQKKQRQETREQNAWTQLMQAAAGSAPGAGQPLPSVTPADKSQAWNQVSNALGQLGQLFQTQAQNDLTQKNLEAQRQTESERWNRKMQLDQEKLDNEMNYQGSKLELDRRALDQRSGSEAVDSLRRGWELRTHVPEGVSTPWGPGMAAPKSSWDEFNADLKLFKALDPKAVDPMLASVYLNKGQTPPAGGDARAYEALKKKLLKRRGLDSPSVTLSNRFDQYAAPY